MFNNKLKKENETLKFCLEFWENEASRLRKDQRNNWQEAHGNDERHYKHDIKQLQDRVDMLLGYIKRTSKCEKCGGDPNRTPGMIPCEECGLIGNAPWGG